MQWEVLVDAAKARYEVIFERADCAFGSVAAMDFGGDQLKLDDFRCEESLECLRAFVVEALQLWAEASGDKACVDDSEREQDGKVTMNVSTTCGRDGASVCEQLTLQYLQRGVCWLSDDGCERLMREIEFRRRRHCKNGGLNRHGQFKGTGSKDD